MEYPDGNSFKLALLCIPGMVQPSEALESLKSTHDSILWLYMCTGPEAHEHNLERERARNLIDVRERLKANVGTEREEEGDRERLQSVRDQLMALMKVSTLLQSHAHPIMPVHTFMCPSILP